MDNKTPPSPTLSEMEFDHLDFPHPMPPLTSSSPPPPIAKVKCQRPSPPVVPPPEQPIITNPGGGKVKLKISRCAHAPVPAGVLEPKKKVPGMTRYLLPKKDESFIGPIMPSQSEAIDLLSHECPSLAHLPPSAISLNLRFDGNTQKSVEGVLFRVLEQAWPGAITDVLPLVQVEVRQTELVKVCETARQKQTKGQTEAKVEHPELVPGAPIDGLTWDDLKKKGAALGIHGNEPPKGQKKPRVMAAMDGFRSLNNAGWKDTDGTGSYHEYHGLLDW
ncbi:hypothetical protein IAR50_000230 [Cryptococcus sp. DSM 104548]